MANKILHKKSNIIGNTPPLSSLSAGEIAINTADGCLFFKKDSPQGEHVSKILDIYNQPHVLNESLSSFVFQFGGNDVSEVFGSVLGGYENDVSGAASTVINGENNDIVGDFSAIANGLDNKILSGGDFSFIAGGKNNLISHENVFTLGSNLSSHANNFTYVNNLSAQGILYGDGSGLTNLATAAAPDLAVRSLTANWESTYTTVLNQSASWIGGASTFNGDISTTTINDVISATVVALQGEPISTQTPNIGQVLQWNGASWTPGAIPNGGSGGGGLIYYLNFANEAQSPTTNLPSTPNTPRELGSEGTIASSSVTKNNVSTTGYDLICGFVSLTGSPNTVTIPAGLWDFNIWASTTSTITKQTSLLLNVYKYDGSNNPTLLASSGDIFIYDPSVTSQYIASVVFPQTTILETDRIYIELTAKATQSNKNITIYFGGTTPTHVHTTFPSVNGSGLVKVINGVYQNPASLLVNSDVASNAAIDQSKINGLTDVANKTNSTYTTVQSNSANWQTTYQASSAYVSSNITGVANSTTISNMIQITQAGYNAINPAVNTLYIIVG